MFWRTSFKKSTVQYIGPKVAYWLRHFQKGNAGLTSSPDLDSSGWQNNANSSGKMMNANWACKVATTDPNLHHLHQCTSRYWSAFQQMWFCVKTTIQAMMQITLLSGMNAKNVNTLQTHTDEQVLLPDSFTLIYFIFFLSRWCKVGLSV